MTGSSTRYVEIAKDEADAMGGCRYDLVRDRAGGLMTRINNPAGSSPISKRSRRVTRPC